MASKVRVAMRIPFFRIIMKSPHARNKAFFQKLLRAKWVTNSARMSNDMLDRIPLHSFAISMSTRAR